MSFECDSTNAATRLEEYVRCTVCGLEVPAAKRRHHICDLCEWNPILHKPATHLKGQPVDGSCSNLAELIVGANGKWRLCRRCWEQDRKLIGNYRVIREVRRD